MKHQISETQILIVKPNNGLVALASFVLDGDLYLGSVGIVTRPRGGYRLLYPTKKMGERNIDLFHPINREVATEIEEVIIKRFEEVMNHDRHSQVDTG